MYGPDGYLYELNLALLATLSDEELTDTEVVAQLTPGTTALVSLGQWLAGAVGRGLVALGERFAPPAAVAEHAPSYWLHPPL